MTSTNTNEIPLPPPPPTPLPSSSSSSSTPWSFSTQKIEYDNVDKTNNDFGNNLSFSTILNSIFFKKFELTASDLLSYGMKMIGLLIFFYIIMPSSLYYILLLCIFIMLVLVYIVNQGSLNLPKLTTPLDPNKVIAFRKQLAKQHLHAPTLI